MKDCLFLKAKQEKEKKNENKNKSDDESEVEANYVLCINEVKSKMDSWIIDSGSTRHICNNKNSFTTMTKLKSKVRLTLPDGKMIESFEEGTCVIKSIDKNGSTVKQTITKVLFVPEMTKNLLSIRKLMKKGYKVNFSKNKCEIKHNNNVIAVGKIKNNLYQIS